MEKVFGVYAIDFKRALVNVEKGISKDFANEALKGFLFKVSKEEVKIITCNGHAIFETSLQPVSWIVDNEEEYFMGEILLEAFKLPTKKVTVGDIVFFRIKDSNKVEVVLNNTSVVVNIIDAKYPDTEEVWESFTKEKVAEIYLNPSYLKDMLDGMESFPISSKHTKIIKLEVYNDGVVFRTIDIPYEKDNVKVKKLLLKLREP